MFFKSLNHEKSMTSYDPVEKSSSHRRPIGSVDVFSWDELIDGRLAAAKAVPGAVFEMVIEGSGKNGKNRQV